MRDRLAVNPQGRRRLLEGLRAKGVAPEVALPAIGEVFAEQGLTERDVAERLARRRAPSLAGLGPEAACRRLAGFLARRGFPPDVVADVTRTCSAAPESSVRDELSHPGE